MITKKALTFIGLFLSLAFLATITAAETSDDFTITNINFPSSVSETAGSFKFSFTLTYTGNSSNMGFSFGSSTSSIGTVSIPDANGFDGTLSQSRVINGTVSGFSDKGGNSLTVRINASSTDGKRDDTKTFTVQINNDGFEFCNWDGTNGFQVGSDIEIKSIKDGTIDNKKEWDWRPFDKVEIEVKIKNDGNSDEDFVTEVVFMDGSTEVDIAEDIDDLEDDLSIDEGKSETSVISFVVDGDIEPGTYNMFVKVYREGDEDFQCVSKEGPESIKARKDSHDVIVKSVDGDKTVEAGKSGTYEVRVANVGRSDEDKVKIFAYNSELGINQFIEIENLDEGDTDRATFVVNFPETAQEKNYKIKFSTEFDYDEDDDTYDEESDSDDDIDYLVNVLEGASQDLSPSISARLVSGSKINDQMLVSVIITNPSNKQKNLIVSLSGLEWAKEISVEPSTFSLGSVESKEVTVRFIPTTSGTQTFSLNVLSDGNTYQRPVSVNIEGKSGVFEFGNMDNQTLAYAIIGVIALLILVLLILIVKVSRRKSPRAEF